MSAPRRLGDFEVQRRIGAGGMAEVFLATKRGAKGTEKRLVIKRLLPEHARSERLRAMFVAEAHLAIVLAHPNLVHVYELADDPTGGLLLAMEYVDGADLGRVLAEVKRRNERLPVEICVRIVELAARGLHYAHEYRDKSGQPLAIVHRDISPQNVLVSRDGAVKVADLGVASARFVRDETGIQPGKLRYMAPEQARGEKVDRRCDVYALAIVLYEMLRLVSPYGALRGNTLARAVREGRVKPAVAQLTDIPSDIAPILSAALAAEPQDRTASARELADALGRVLFERRAHVDEAAIAAALAPYIDAAAQQSEVVSSAAQSVEPGEPSAPVSAPNSDEVATVAAKPRAAPRVSLPPESLRAGDVFGRYVLEAHIGRGGMAEVFRARDTVLGREIALKVLRTDSDSASRERMLIEAQAAAAFQHSGSVVVYDVGDHEGRPYIAMELVRGRTLTTYLGDSSVPLERKLRWCSSVARVLAAAHRAGLVHRDVKPSNVIVRDDGEVKVVDFGIVRRHVADLGSHGEVPLTAAGAIVGTPGYAAPEQLLGDTVDGRADQFAWAVTLYELIAGRRPWTGDHTAQVVTRTLFEPFPPLQSLVPDLPTPVLEVVDRALSRDASARFASLDEPADALAPFCEVVAAPRSVMPSAPGLGSPSESGERLKVAPVVAAPIETKSKESVPIDGGTQSPSATSRLPALAGAAFVAFALALVFVYTFRGAQNEYTSAPTAAPAPVPTVAAIRCQNASVSGDSDPEIARALGLGACARLAVELGVEWSVDGPGMPLDVRVDIAGTSTKATLHIAGASVDVTAPEPLKTVDHAVLALAQKLKPPPLTAAEVQAWGAKDEASARRIARVFRRRDLRISTDLGPEALRLLDTDPESPFSHLLVLMVSAGGPETLSAAPQKVRERLHLLPAARQNMIRGLLHMFPVEVDRKEAARLARQSYAETPNDPELVALYVVVAIRLGLPEAYAVLDRLIEMAPTHAVVALDNALLRAPDDDAARALRYAAHLIEILPETRASAAVVQTYLHTGKLAEARSALDVGKRLGLRTMGDALSYEAALIDLHLAELDTEQARSLLQSLLADPRPYARNQAANAEITSHFLDGRVGQAFASLTTGIRLGIDTGYTLGTARLLIRDLAATRWLGRPPLDPAHMEWLLRVSLAPDQLVRAVRAEAQVELVLAQTGPDAPRAREKALEALEAEAKAAQDDPLLHDDLLIQTVPLVRLVRGDREAVAVFQSASRARPPARLRRSIDAGLAFEALRDLPAAARAYAFACDPAVARESGIERVIASVRLDKLPAVSAESVVGRPIPVTKLDASADPGLVAHIRALK